MRRFRSSVFCGKDRLLLVQTTFFKTFEILHVHKKLLKTPEERVNSINSVVAT